MIFADIWLHLTLLYAGNTKQHALICFLFGSSMDQKAHKLYTEISLIAGRTCPGHLYAQFGSVLQIRNTVQILPVLYVVHCGHSLQTCSPQPSYAQSFLVATGPAGSWPSSSSRDMYGPVCDTCSMQRNKQESSK